MIAAALEEDRAEWFADARLMIERLAKTEPQFCADDLRKIMRPAPNKHWAGLAFGQASKAGLIEKVETTKSKVKSRHGGIIHTWRRKQEGVTP
jgi:hypothetical protein